MSRWNLSRRGFLGAALAFGSGARADNISPAEQIVAAGAPGAGMAIWRDGQLATDVAGERRKGSDEAIRADDLWHLGSNGKAMTATLAARLVVDGVLAWDSKLADVIEVPQFYANVTLTDLLNHRSGLPANPGMWRMIEMGTEPNADLSADREKTVAAALSKEPVQGFSYSNIGYMAAGLLMERKAGQPFEQLMQEQLFIPLGMESVGFGPPAGNTGHASGFFGRLRPMTEGADNPPAFAPAGTFHMTMADHMTFCAAYLRRDPLLPDAAWDVLQGDAYDYVMGWGVIGDLRAHSGSNTMWYARIMLDLRKQVAVGCYANAGMMSLETAMADVMDGAF